jgi:hypothetical protein
MRSPSGPLSRSNAHPLGLIQRGSILGKAFFGTTTTTTTFIYINVGREIPLNARSRAQKYSIGIQMATFVLAF